MNFRELGIVISSPVLITESGSLKVRIRLSLSLDSLDKLLEGICNQCDFREDKIFSKENLDVKNPDRVSSINSIFFKVFKFKFTSFKGWSDSDFFNTDFNVEERILDLTFELDKKELKPVVYNQKVHGGNFDTDWPIIKIVLNNEASLPPYRLLQILEAEEVAIEVQVSCVEKMQISNQLGDLDLGSPFQPFGPLPTIGSKIKIGSPYFLSKYLIKLDLQLRWSGLPLVRTGFTDYYKEYPFDYRNESFLAEISIQNGKIPVKHHQAYQEFELFETENRDDGKYLTDYKSVSINLENFEVDKGPGLSAEERSRNELSLVLSLSNPPQAFGLSVYAELFAAASLKNSRFRRRKHPFPNQPYTPVLEHLLVDYTNYTKENLLDKNPKNNINIKIYPLDSTLQE